MKVFIFKLVCAQKSGALFHDAPPEIEKGVHRPPPRAKQLMCAK